MTASILNTKAAERLAREAAVRDAEAVISDLERDSATTLGDVRRLEREAGASDGETAAVKLVAARARVTVLARERRAADTPLLHAKEALEYHRHEEAAARARIEHEQSKACKARADAIEHRDIATRLDRSAAMSDLAVEAAKADLVRMVGAWEPPPQTQAQKFAEVLSRHDEMRR